MKETRKRKQTVGRVRQARPTRAYSRDFTPSRGDGHDFKIRRIPDAFWKQVQSKAKREGVSLRGMLLTHLQQWVEAGK